MHMHSLYKLYLAVVRILDIMFDIESRHALGCPVLVPHYSQQIHTKLLHINQHLAYTHPNSGHKAKITNIEYINIDRNLQNMLCLSPMD